MRRSRRYAHRQARRLCPDIIAVPSRFDAYVAASRDLFEVFRRTAPVVEGLSMEEAFLDVRGLDHIRGSPPEVARGLRADVREEVGLAVSVGLATSKVVAKMGSAAAKPDGLLHVAPGEERAFLHPLAIERVWGVGKASATRLRAHGIATVGDVAAVSEDALAAILGRAHGSRLHAIAAGGRFRPVRSGRSRRSFGAQRAIGLRRYARGDLERSLDALVDRVTRRMRKSHRVGRTVILRMRFGDFARASRSHTLHAPAAQTLPIQEAARALLAASRPLYESRGLTMVGVTVTNVEPDGGGIQLGSRSRGRTRRSTPRSTSSASASAPPASPGRATSTGRPPSSPRTCSPARRSRKTSHDVDPARDRPRPAPARRASRRP